MSERANGRGLSAPAASKKNQTLIESSSWFPDGVLYGNLESSDRWLDFGRTLTGYVCVRPFSSLSIQNGFFTLSNAELYKR
jgi:hypothetical protein